jgi:hypothetical protein
VEAAVGKPGPANGCAAWRDVIVSKMDAGLSAERIHQDLRAEHEFTGSYWSVRRFMRQVAELFREERRALLPLPADRFAPKWAAPLPGADSQSG